MTRSARSERSRAARSWARAEPRQRFEAVLIFLLALSIAALVAVETHESGPDVRQVQPDRPPADWFVIWASGLDEYPMCCADSPAELIEQRDPPVIVVGAVEGIERGRNFWFTTADRASGTEPMHFLVLRVRVSQTLRAEGDGLIHDGRVYVELDQGPTQAHRDGSVGMAYPLSRWREGMPVGTRVMLFLYRDKWHVWGNDVVSEHEGRGLPDGAKLTKVDPQAFIVEYRGEIAPFGDDDYRRQGGRSRIADWNVDSIDEIAGQVRRYLDRDR